MLTVHLWKEWREQRLLLGVFVLALVTIALGFGLLAPARAVPADVEVWFVIVALGAGFVALAGDLVPGEQRRGQLGFLLRTPGALRAAFVAKFAWLLVGLAALCGIGWGLGLLCLELAGGRGLPDRVETLGHAPAVIEGIAIGVLTCAPWAFAVSTWMPRGASVVPATALTLAAIVAPAVLVAATYSVPVTRTEATVAIALVFVGGVLAAWLSFTKGLRFGRRAATCLHGLAAAAVFVVPSWVWSAERAWTWHHADPADADLHIGEALLGADGRTAFVSVARDWDRNNGPGYALVVDLETGAWRQHGPAQGWFFGVGALERHEWLSGLSAPQPLIGHYRLDDHGQSIVGRTVLDGTTGAVLASIDDGRTPDALRERLRDAQRATAPLRLPDGTRVWFEERTTVWEGADGVRDVQPWPDGLRPGLTVGFGFEWWRDGATGRSGEFLDLTRRRTIRAADAAGRTPIVRPGAWLGEERDGARRLPTLWDPETGETKRLELAAGEEVEALAGDGRLVVLDGDGRATLLDPEAGAREALTVRADIRIDGVSPADYRTFRAPTRTPDGRDVFRLAHTDAARHYRWSFARRDGTHLATTVTVLADDLQLVAIPDDDHVLVIRDRRTLERWRFDSDDVDVLFRVGGR